MGSSTYFMQFSHLSCLGCLHTSQYFKTEMVLPQLRHDSNLILINSENSISLVIFRLILIVGILVDPTYYEKGYLNTILKIGS